MNSDAIAAALADLFGDVTAPSGEAAIALATEELPDAIGAKDLPCLLVWPPLETPVVQAGTDRSKLSFPVVLYLPRVGTTKARIGRLYKWRDVIRLLPQTVSSHLNPADVAPPPLPYVASAGSTQVTVNDPADSQYGTQLYDTVRVDVLVQVDEGNVFWQP